MLRVKTYLDQSTISGAGIGCFALEDIKEGEVIWEFDPFFDRVYTKENLETMKKLDKDFINTYTFSHGGLYYLCIDNARFFNHSKEPNTLDPAGEYRTYAARDIKKGEEILSDYATFGNTEEDKAFNLIL